MFYSKSTNGFYVTDIHGTNIPEDAVEITDDQHATMLAGQSSGKIISADINGYPDLIDPPAENAHQMWKKIQLERDRRKNGGFKVGDKWFHSDSESLTRYLGLIQLGVSLPARNWKTMDGSLVPMTQELAGEIFSAAAVHDGACFDAGESHKSAMEASQDPSIYDYSTGWPEIFTSSQ